jgi:hypothetical protein
MDVVNEHPEAMDALQSVQRPAACGAGGDLVGGRRRVDHHRHGTAPDGFGDLSQLVVSGDRLTTAGTSPCPLTAPNRGW